MIRIDRATPGQAERLFDIMVQATVVGCAPSYPPDVIAIWHEGRTAAGMADAIASSDIYALRDGDTIQGFVHIAGSEVVGLFVHPDHHRQGYGTQLFRFAKEKITERPLVLKATLNAVSFYTKLGCRQVSTESVRRHDKDIYIVKMVLD